MRIIMPSFEEIKLMPPTISLIDLLAMMGYDVAYITVYPDEYCSHFDKNKVTNVALFSRKISLREAMPKQRLLQSIAFRIDNVLKSFFAHRLAKWLDRNMHKEDLLWVVNEMVPLLAGAKFSEKYKDNYIFTIYELHSDTYKWRHVKRVANNASVVVVPEYNRAHIQKSYWNLKKLPLVLPNKPLNHPLQKNLPIKNTGQANIINNLKEAGKQIILYMGIIGSERPLDKIIEAVKEMPEFEFVVLGRSSTYLDDLLVKYPNGFTYLGSAVPPEHLAIASHADIGLLVYVADNNNLNALYCAPNKVFEYTGFGMPIITNDIPGLNYFIERYHCGASFDLEDKASIIKAISLCVDNRDLYAKASMNLYNDVDLPRLIAGIIEKYQVLKSIKSPY